MKSGLKNVLNKVLTEKKGESSSDKGDKSTIEEIPYSKRVEIANRRKAIIKDRKTLNKKQFLEKYKSYTEKDFKELNIPGAKNYNVDTLYEETNDIWDENKENKDIEKFTGLVKKQEEEEKALDIKSQNIAAGYKSYMTESQKAKQLKEEIQKKYPNAIDKPFQPVNYQQEYETGIINDAKKQIQSNVGITLPSDPNKQNPHKEEQMTCITGVCTLANQQGVSFDAMKNTGGVQYDATRKAYIPVSNASFRANLDKTGYEEVPLDQRKPSDFIQYVAPSHQHMEIMLNNDKNNVMTSFNNYGLSNYGTGGYKQDPNDPSPGESERQIKKNSEGKWVEYNRNPETGVWQEGFQEVHAYRPKKETYEAAYINKHPEYAQQLKMQQEFENSDQAKAYKELNSKLGSSKAFDELGDDATLFKNADADVSKYKSAEEMKSALLSKAKNSKLVSKVIDKLYSNN